MSKDKKLCIGSPRSKNSILQEEDLRKSLEKVQGSIASTEAKVLQLEGEVERVTQKVLGGRVEYQDGLDRAIANLATLRGRLGPYKAEAARLKGAIEAMQPSQAEKDTRRKGHEEFKGKADERMDLARAADRQVSALCETLIEYGRLSAEMQRVAGSFDLPVFGELLDASRFEKLLGSLPQDLLRQSQRWYDHFFGSKTDKTYVVIADCLTLPENFSSAGVFKFGDRVQLAEEDAELSSLMSEEDFQALVKDAKTNSRSVPEELVYRQHVSSQRIATEQARERHEMLWGRDSLSHPLPGDERAAHEKLWGNNPAHPFPEA